MLFTDVPDHSFQTCLWGPNCDPEAVSICGAMAHKELGCAHLNDVDPKSQWLLVRHSAATCLSGRTRPSRCMRGRRTVVPALVLPKGQRDVHHGVAVS